MLQVLVSELLVLKSVLRSECGEMGPREYCGFRKGTWTGISGVNSSVLMWIRFYLNLYRIMGDKVKCCMWMSCFMINVNFFVELYVSWINLLI